MQDSNFYGELARVASCAIRHEKPGICVHELLCALRLLARHDPVFAREVEIIAWQLGHAFKVSSTATWLAWWCVDSGGVVDELKLCYLLAAEIVDVSRWECYLSMHARKLLDAAVLKLATRIAKLLAAEGES